MTHRACFAALLVLSLASASSPGYAMWGPDGVSVCAATDIQDMSRIIADGGGAIVVWEDTRNTLYKIYAQRLNAAGVMQWTTDGVALTSASFAAYRPSLTSDGSGGAIVACTQNVANRQYPFAQRLNAAGARQWGDGAVPLSTHSGAGAQVVSDGSGGGIVVWYSSDLSEADPGLYVQRVNGAGEPQWNDGVNLLPGYIAREQTIIPDGLGGAIISWADVRIATDSDIYVQRVNAAGVAQWTAGGVAVETAVNGQTGPSIVSDEAGGCIIAWIDARNGSDRDVYVQHMDATGAAQWTSDGVPLATGADEQTFPKIVSDGAGGAIVSWQGVPAGCGFSSAYVQRVSAAGVAQWTAGGVLISDCGLLAQFGQPLGIIADGTGGAIATWLGDQSMRAQRVNAAGVAQWTAGGEVISTVTCDQSQPPPGIVSDGLGGAIVAWDTFTGRDIYAQRVSGGVTGVSSPASLPFAVYAPHPDPTDAGATITFDLPVAEPASVGVYDVSGQLVRNLLARGDRPAGAQTLVWNGASDSGAEARAGVYFIRVSAADAVVTRRLTILR